MCSHFFNCYEPCSSNSGCSSFSACCSEGYCTHEVVCQGNKVNGDYCDQDEECLTRYCDIEFHNCAVRPEFLSEWSTTGIILILVSLIIIVLFLIYCCQLMCSSKHHSVPFSISEYRTSSSGDSATKKALLTLKKSGYINSFEASRLQEHLLQQGESDGEPALTKLVNGEVSRQEQRDKI